MQHPVDALFDQEVIFLTPAGAQDLERLGVLLELGDEVVDDAVVGALTDDVAEAVHPGANAEQIAIRGDEGFRGDFSRAVKREGDQRPRCFIEGPLDRLAVNCARRREQQVSMPFRCMASSTLQVAMTSLSRSMRCFLKPEGMSVLAARWNTMSCPFIASTSGSSSTKSFWMNLIFPSRA